jgi:hypothetical protein
VARFDGGSITSDAGILLLKAVEERRGVLARFAACFRDSRGRGRSRHTVGQLVSQRVLGIALGYEDLNDHLKLRLDPLLAAVIGKLEPELGEGKSQPLAGPATLSRLENSHPGLADSDRYRRISLDQAAVDRLLVEVMLEAQGTAPEELVLDLDSTDDPLHGKQQGRFFHGHYDGYCYLPLYIFAGDHLLCARLRTADRDGADGALEEVRRIVEQIRTRWPSTRIIIRGDSGFCREDLMSWCEAENVDYVLGLARNSRLEEMIKGPLETVRKREEVENKAVREFAELEYCTNTTWSRSRRVVAKAEQLPGRSNPRFVVSSLPTDRFDARALYEDLYCARGDMENRIKEQQLDLFADRTSCSLFRANQVRLYFSSIAYVLLNELRRIALAGTEMARAQCGTIRTKLLKIGARVRISVRRIWVSMANSCPVQDLLLLAWQRLRQA